VKQKNLTDDQCWKIWCVLDYPPDLLKIPFPRKMAIAHVRTWLKYGRTTAFKILAFLFRDDEPELSVFLEELARAKRKLN
jgi:hypothetical protein